MENGSRNSSKIQSYMRWKKKETSILQTIQSLYEID
jgi:hypothetical protein